MEKSSNLVLEWSKLNPLNSTEIDKIPSISGVFRISKRETDGKYYVIYIGSAENLKDNLNNFLQGDPGTEIKKEIDIGADIKFKYSLLEPVELRKAVEKQMFKTYVPKYNLSTGEPVSQLEVKVNLN